MTVRVSINVSGTRFEFNTGLLDGHEHETLAKLCNDAMSTQRIDTGLSLEVDRPVECFTTILGYYQTGELHMPHTVCPKAFKKELEFWRVSPTVLESCCVYRYYTFFDDLETREKFRLETFTTPHNAPDRIPITTENKLTRLRRRIWNAIDYQEKTVQSKIYLAIVFCMVLLCTVTLALSTVKSLQRKVKRCEMLEYLEHSDSGHFTALHAKLGNPNCDDFNDDHEIHDDDYEFEYESDQGNNQTIKLPTIMVRLLVFDVLEYFAAAFFTFDILLRIGTCPSLPKFLKSILNIFDILAIISFYLHIIITQIFMKDHKYTMSWVKAIGYLQIFRVMRFFRIARNLRASRVLAFSLRSNAKDMVLMILFILIAMSFFGSLIFFIENGKSVDSIPEAWYFIMITLTTVGYGDITPVTVGGRLTAAILAVCGVLLLAITVPVFVNNFLSLYQFSCMDEILEKHKTSQKTLKKTVHATLAVMGKRDQQAEKEIYRLEDVDNIPTEIRQNKTSNDKIY